MEYRQESIAIAQRPRDYAGLLWIFAASALGFSLFCGASAVALSDPSLEEPIAVQAGDVVNFAFSNQNSVQTLEAFSALIPTSTNTPVPTASPTQTSSPTPSSTITKTPIIIPATVTRKPNNPPPPPPRPTNRPPTNTAIVIQTYTASPFVPEPTDTPEPTETQVPPPTSPPPTSPPATNTPG